MRRWCRPINPPGNHSSYFLDLIYSISLYITMPSSLLAPSWQLSPLFKEMSTSYWLSLFHTEERFMTWEAISSADWRRPPCISDLYHSPTIHCVHCKRPRRRLKQCECGWSHILFHYYDGRKSFAYLECFTALVTSSRQIHSGSLDSRAIVMLTDTPDGKYSWASIDNFVTSQPRPNKDKTVRHSPSLSLTARVSS